MPLKHSQVNRPWRHLYKTKRWQDLRIATFKRDLFRCQICKEPTILTRDRKDPKAATCDHIVPHKGDEGLFFDPDNLQTTCKQCHDGAKQSEEIHGYSKEIGEDGFPIDDRHPFNKKN